ncbi:hypothetical protein EDD16DRAFT_1558842 [Pisolithus croceorrhizus]|nr:hypothetical protein EV401DRAFT_1954276 [Pisolithus croceorrhizus]KAI6125418.1 hypothetical protein EDD16DRAFT_1558842 [Pisolithus croceorrhizus]
MSAAQPLRISYIELRSANLDVECVEVLFLDCRRSIQQQANNHFREEFPQPLTVQGETFSFSVHRKRWYFPYIPDISNIQINVREILSDSRLHKFQTVRSSLDITIGLSPDRPSADVVSAQDNPTPPNTDSPRPTTEALLKQCPRFRILVVGKTGAGKSSLIDRVFGTELPFRWYRPPGLQNIDEGLISKQNERVVLHCCDGFVPNGNDSCNTVKSFIMDRKNREHVKDQLHAVWLCFPVPIIEYGERLLEDGTETFWQKIASVLENIPTVVVFTKYDRLLAYMDVVHERDPEVEAERYLQRHCIGPITTLAGGVDLSYVAVSCRFRLF